jgi:Uma2 family endonuclease
MGTIAERPLLSQEALLERWAQVLADPALADLPYKIELDEWGDIRMTPVASPRHMRIAFTLGRTLEAQLGGKAFQEGSVATTRGVLAADVVWCSEQYVALHSDVFRGGAPAMTVAPEICIEVASPSNTVPKLERKMRAFLDAGAEEGWIVLDDLSIRVFGLDGERSQSRYALQLETWRREHGAG